MIPHYRKHAYSSSICFRVIVNCGSARPFYYIHSSVFAAWWRAIGCGLRKRPGWLPAENACGSIGLRP